MHFVWAAVFAERIEPLCKPDLVSDNDVTQPGFFVDLELI